MRNVPATMTAAWKGQLKEGATRAVCRATIQRANVHRHAYDTAMAHGDFYDGGRSRTGHFASMLFGDPSPVIEIPNIKSFTWERDTEQDVAKATMVLLNAGGGAVGADDDLELAGIMTYNRGQQAASANRWGFDTDTGWQGLLVPDRMVRTYEGYGCDRSQPPALDPMLMPSGVWLIDDVEYGEDGTITLEMRDVGRLLLDQIVFPPVIPLSEYPLSWSKIRTEQVEARDCKGGSWVEPTGKCTSSNSAYIGKGLQDPPYPEYVTANGGFNGHHPAHGLHYDDQGYWLSTGQTTRSSKVWWQVDFNSPHSLAGLRINCKGGTYRMYVSIKNAKGKWVGKKKIPYTVTTEGIDNGARIPFVKSVIADRGHNFDVILPRKYKNATAVRLTFSHLWDTGVGNYPFRAGLNHFKIYTGDYDDLGFGKGTVDKVVGNYGDYIHIVKWALAWAGWFWPGLDDYIVVDEHGTKKTLAFDQIDQVLPKGRVWGSFHRAGTAGEADLTVDLFDKQPLMDMIAYVRDILGYTFHIDEVGAAHCRMPNLWEAGNYLSADPFGQPHRKHRTSRFVTIDETETLIGYKTRLSSRNIRERFFVGNTTGKVGTVIKGFNPYPTGMMRVAGWTDQNFGSKAEIRVTASMLATRSMFDYRTGSPVIPGNPAIQIDDQIRIFARVTNETYYHYVKGIKSTLDNETGKWTYDLDTHWLGEDPNGAWAVKITELDTATRNYLNEVSEDV